MKVFFGVILGYTMFYLFVGVTNTLFRIIIVHTLWNDKNKFNSAISK